VDVLKINLPTRGVQVVPKALIQNRDRSVYDLIPLNNKLLERMAGEKEAFFEGVYDKANKTPVLQKRINNPNW
jgi:hypothetical protein